MKKTTAPQPILQFALLFFILLLAAWLRFSCLTCSSLWHDEGNAWALAQRTFAQIARDAAADIHPPGYYWLLKLWAGLFGGSAWGIRSFSASAALLTVAVVYRIGLEIGRGTMKRRSLFALLAAFLAALSPFQIFYGQEARMYALLMLESAALFWALLGMKGRWAARGGRAEGWLYGVVYLLAAMTGLWTHYFFAVALAAAGGTAAWWWWPRRAEERKPPGVDEWPSTPHRDAHAARGRHWKNPWLPLLAFLALSALALLSYLPWLPTAIERLLSWPSQNGIVDLLEGLRLTLQTLAAGPLRSGPQLAWGWLSLVGLLPLVGAWRLRRSGAGAALLLWLLLPIAVMFAFGLFNPAFLKFLLVASPAWCLLTAAAAQPLSTQLRAQRAPNSRFWRAVPFGAVAGLAAALALAALPSYYTDPAARDNYAGMARTVAALGDPDQDLVILNAPGQADVWRYYGVGVDSLPLPAQRPPDRAATEETLARETAGRRQIFALLWATEQSDPDGIVEGWLGRHAFKGLESWQGNVRFASYTLPHSLSCAAPDQPPQFGDVATLSEICLSDEPLAAGETLLVGLRWQPLTPPQRPYKVTAQLLDSRDQVVVQRDGEPGGGTRPTLGWQVGEVVADNHGLPLPPGTPPGVYRLIVAMYDAETGARLPTPTGDALLISQPTLGRPDQPLPASIVQMQRRADRKLGPLTVVGYDFYRKGFAHAPQTAVASGDLLQVTLYWQAPTPLPDSWPADLALRLRLGDQVVDAPLVGGGYPTGQWQAGEFVRGTFDILFDGASPTLWLEVGDARLRLGRVPLDR